ncbi:unnamed protein product, partial [marine sediment metagenome]
EISIFRLNLIIISHHRQLTNESLVFNIYLKYSYLEPNIQKIYKKRIYSKKEGFEFSHSTSLIHLQILCNLSKDKQF